MPDYGMVVNLKWVDGRVIEWKAFCNPHVPNNPFAGYQPDELSRRTGGDTHLHPLYSAHCAQLSTCGELAALGSHRHSEIPNYRAPAIIR